MNFSSAELIQINLSGVSMRRERQVMGRRIYFNGIGNAGGDDGAPKKSDSAAQKEEKKREAELEKEARRTQEAIKKAEGRVGHQGSWAN